MKVHIQTLDFTPRQSLLDLVNEKVEKLEKFSDRIIDSRVILRIEKSSTNNNKVCEIRLGIPGNDLFVKKQTESFEESLQKAVDTLERQLKDWKEKKKS